MFILKKKYDLLNKEFLSLDFKYDTLKKRTWHERKVFRDIWGWNKCLIRYKRNIFLRN
jgi:hypothetical protein